MTGGNEEMKKSFIHNFLSMRINSGDEGKLRKNSYDPTEVASGIHVLDSMAMSHDMQSLRVFAATWNVGGKSPSSDLDLDNFLQVHCQSDIYILGFQEIVPLNAGNVLVIEDNGTAAKWLSLISQSLNKSCNFNYSPIKRTNTNSCSFERNCSGSSSLFLQRTSLKTANKAFRSESRRRLKSCNCNVVEPERKSYGKDSCFTCPKSKSKSNACDYASSSEEDDNLYKSGVSADGSTATPPRKNQHLRYSLIKSKQMVGIFVTIWVKNELVPYLGHLRTSCISRGILGCLGNKGCIAVSMTFKQTSFCFVASHLAAGEKEGDELRRNLDVIEILKNTQFPKICKTQNTRVPDKILGHDRVIWLGDLNYRIALSYHETKKLLEQDKWDVLLHKDQLKIERKAGRVFAGWKEGKIGFPPTYKYSYNSDLYAGDTIQSKSKRRTPAWCDRILWYGDGIHQKSYARWDSRFSDHRPVCATFLIFLHHLRF